MFGFDVPHTFIKSSDSGVAFSIFGTPFYSVFQNAYVLGISLSNDSVKASKNLNNL